MKNVSVPSAGTLSGLSPSSSTNFPPPLLLLLGPHMTWVFTWLCVISHLNLGAKQPGSLSLPGAARAGGTC